MIGADAEGKQRRPSPSGRQSLRDISILGALEESQVESTAILCSLHWIDGLSRCSSKPPSCVLHQRPSCSHYQLHRLPQKVKLSPRSRLSRRLSPSSAAFSRHTSFRPSLFPPLRSALSMLSAATYVSNSPNLLSSLVALC